MASGLLRLPFERRDDLNEALRDRMEREGETFLSNAASSGVRPETSTNVELNIYRRVRLRPRRDSPQFAHLLYKVIVARHRRRSTALVTNIDFDGWADDMIDGPLAMAFLDRLVEGAIILKIKGRSYRARSAKTLEPSAKNSK